MTQKKVKSVRGMGDILPCGQKNFIYQSQNWLWVCDQFRSWAEVHGYRYIETPVVEELELFKRTSGETSDIVGKEMYLVGRSSAEGPTDFSLAMRPEGSAGVCRAVSEHGLSRNQPELKFYYIAPMFRSERPQRGRYRQHTQVGIEIFKEEGAATDVEVLSLQYGFYRKLGLKEITLKLNSVGDKDCRPVYRKVLIEYLEQFKDAMSEDSKSRLYTNPLRCLDSKDPKDQELFKDAPSILDYLNDDCKDHFDEVKLGLDKLGIPYEIDSRLVRGLDYYTKTAFEFSCETLDGSIKVIGGGGRYDGLVEQIGGAPTPGIGFGSSIERILLAVESQKITVPASVSASVLVAYLDSGVKYDALALTEELRDSGVYTDFIYQAKNLGKQMKEASNKDVDFVVIVGGEEWDRGEVMLKHFKTREQEVLPKEKLLERLSALLNSRQV